MLASSLLKPNQRFTPQLLVVTHGFLESVIQAIKAAASGSELSCVLCELIQRKLRDSVGWVKQAPVIVAVGFFLAELAGILDQSASH